MMDAPAPMPEATPSTDAPGTVRGLIAALLEALHTRLELAGVELEIHLRALVSDAETLLRSTTNAGGADAQEQAQATLQELRARLSTLEDTVRARARDVDSYVRDNPWQAVAAAGGVALLLGLIMGRSR